MGRVFDFRFLNIAIGLWVGELCFFAYITDSKNWLWLLLVAVAMFFHYSRSRKALAICILIGILITSGRFYFLHKNDVDIESLNQTNRSFIVTGDPQLVQERFAGSLNFAKDIFVYADLQGKEGYLPIALTVDSEDSPLATGLPSSVWSCKVSLKVAPPNRRYIAFGRCITSPKLVSRESNLQHLAGVFRQKLAKLSYLENSSDAASLMPGLVVGDNQAQSDELVTSLRVAGLGHLTAVSGANVAILLLFIQFLLQKTQLSDRWRLVILLCVLVAFVVVARPSPSVVRAAMMAGVTLAFWIKGLQKLSEGILFLSVTILILIDPWLAISWGFALSVCATFGLILLPRFWKIDQYSNLFLKLGGTALAASIATTPILLAMGSPVTFASIPANVLAEFMVPIATIFGLIAPIISLLPFLNLFAPLFANIAIGASGAIVAIAKFFSNSIFATELVSIKGMIFGTALLIASRYRRKRSVLIMILITLTVLNFGSSKYENSWKIDDWEIAVCDVGQGDSTLIRTGVHSAMVVDVGPETDAMKNCLNKFGITKVDLFVASHFHADHIGGISGLVEVARPIRVVTAALSAPSSGVEIVERALSPVERESANIGMAGDFENGEYSVSWQVVGPVSGDLYVDQSNGSAINNNSVVLLVETRHHRVLLTGDIEIDGQIALTKSITNPEVDIVKVPHHGSAYQAPEFANWVNADLAWISVGKENSYGHPNSTTIALFTTAGSMVLTTMECGHIAIGSSSYSTSRPCV